MKIFEVTLQLFILYCCLDTIYILVLRGQYFTASLFLIGILAFLILHLRKK